MRIVPTLLLLGLLSLGLTQSIASQVIGNQFPVAALSSTAVRLEVKDTVLSESNPPGPMPTLTVSREQAPSYTPAKPNSVQKSSDLSASVPRLEITPPVPLITSAASSATASNTTDMFSAGIETEIRTVMSTASGILQEIHVINSQVKVFGNRNVAEADGPAQTPPILMDALTRKEPPDGQYDLSRLRLENLAQVPTLQIASQPEIAAAAKAEEPAKVAAIATQFDLGASGLIPDETAKLLAQQEVAPHLWPVKGPVTSTFGPRAVLIIPATTQSATGKGGVSPTTTANNTATAPHPTPTPTATATPVVTPTVSPAAAASQPTPAVPPTINTTQPTPLQSEIIQTPAIQMPTDPATIPAAAFYPLPVSPAPTGAISPEPINTPIVPTATATPTPTPIPTTTPFPSGPIPLINGNLEAVRAGEEYHTGLDIAVIVGTEVHATADGVVLYAGNGGGYGLVVFIQHAGGFVTVYGHNSRLLVETGQTVKAGQTISLSGSTGYSTGPHVHYEVRYQGKIANPAFFLK